jgi:O-antigen/teichoic acid export membrane protein
VVAPDFVPWLLKDKWKPIIIPLQMLCPVGILTVFSATFTPTLIALGRPDVNLRYTALCVVILPAGFILAGLEWGVVGVAGVWLIVFPILFAGLIHATREITKISLGRLIRTQAPIVAASAIMAAGVWGVGQSVGDDLTIRVLAQVAAGVAIYTPAILALTRFEVIAEIRDVLRDLRAPTA